MNLRNMLFIAGLLSYLAVPGDAAADYPIEVIELRAALLEEILPVVRPLVGADGTVTGMGNNLVIKAAPGQVREIRKLLAEIDRPPRRLLITVSNAGDESFRSSGYSARADVKVGDARIGVNSPGRPDGDSRARLDLYGHDASRGRTASQQIQVLEGRPAWIHAGTRVPVSGGYPPSAGFQDNVSGFYVVPRISGERVTLEILQSDTGPGTPGGARDIQRAGTMLSGALGEWILLGGIDSAGNARQDGTARSMKRETSAAQQIRVRVECPDCRSQ